MTTPVPTGEYAVGTFTYTVKDDRVEALDPSVMRSVASRVYYPVRKQETEGLKKAKYMSRNTAEGIRKLFMIPLNYDKIEAAGENVSECFENAPRPEGEKFPLIMFSHGLGSFREGNSFLCIELASRGYVVISVAHSPDGICTEFDDGSFIPFDKSFTRKTYEPFLGGIIAALKLTMTKGTNEELAKKFDTFQDKYCAFQKSRLEEWVKDTRAALRYAKDNLSDMIDFDKGIGASGHSFGGDTAYALCANDPDYACGINIDGALFGDYKDTIQKKPFMQISCKDNENVVTRVYLKHEQPVWKVLFLGMKHVGFSDMKFRIRLSSMAGKLSPEAMHENLCRCHLAFFDTYLKGIGTEPELTSNDVITVTKYEADIQAREVEKTYPDPEKYNSPVLSVAKMRDADRYTIEKGAPSKELMRRAAQGVFDSFPDWAGHSILIVCGSGNNAGDGYALAEILKDHGIDAEVYCLYDRFSEDGEYYYQRCLEKGIKILRRGQDMVDFGAYGIIVDCMLGTGFSGIPREPIAGAIDSINKAKENHGAFVISVDINSGMNGDTGEAETAVKSDLTVSVGYLKTGFFLGKAKELIGQLVNVDIGIEIPENERP